MISDQGDKISFFDINQSRFFVCSPSIKKYLMWKNILEQDNFLCIQIKKNSSAIDCKFFSNL